MNFLRNNEVLKILLLQIFISVSAIGAAFIWDMRFGIFTLVLTLLLLLISTLSNYVQYLLEEIPKHMNDTNCSFIENLLPWSENLPAEIRKP